MQYRVRKGFHLCPLRWSGTLQNLYSIYIPSVVLLFRTSLFLAEEEDDSTSYARCIFLVVRHHTSPCGFLSRGGPCIFPFHRTHPTRPISLSYAQTLHLAIFEAAYPDPMQHGTLKLLFLPLPLPPAFEEPINNLRKALKSLFYFGRNG